MMRDPLESPESTLTWLRGIWALQLVGVMVISLLATTMNIGNTPRHLLAQWNISYLQIAMLSVMVIAVGIGYFTRMQIYKRNWQGEMVTPQGYFYGNLLLFSSLDFTVFLTCFFVFVTGQITVLLAPIVVPAVLLAINFPTGSPMQPYRSPL